MTRLTIDNVSRAASRALRIVTSAVQRRHSNVGPPELWKMKRQFQIEFLVARGLKPGDRLLDIGCGTLRGGIPLIDYLDAGNYFGLDTRAEVIEEARRELADHGLEHKQPVLIVNSDFGQLGDLPEFDKIWSFSVLFHMTDEIVTECFRFVGQHLARDGAFYANVHLGENRVEKWKSFPVVWRTLDHYARLAADNGLHMEDLGELRALGHVSGLDGHDSQVMLRFTRTSDR